MCAPNATVSPRPPPAKPPACQVAPLFRFESEAEAVAMANDTPYGLAAYFFTKDMGRRPYCVTTYYGSTYYGSTYYGGLLLY